jgi:hypothetical protein
MVSDLDGKENSLAGHINHSARSPPDQDRNLVSHGGLSRSVKQFRLAPHGRGAGPSPVHTSFPIIGRAISRASCARYRHPLNHPFAHHQAPTGLRWHQPNSIRHQTISGSHKPAAYSGAKVTLRPSKACRMVNWQDNREFASTSKARSSMSVSSSPFSSSLSTQAAST